MKTNLLGYPRIGNKRELKKSSEAYWKKTISKEEHLKNAASIRKNNWLLQQKLGIDLIPSNDFSLYDQVLDMSVTVGSIPKRYSEIKENENELDLYFAMARGIQNKEFDITAMEMTKWFDTNYHYIVPEFYKNQIFELFDLKPINEYKEALGLGIKTKPVLIGPVTYLL
ncbi:MAG: 5-methyltetrahydropteroyltriglutamate--homocysteine S-methyltransferase, partial [Flavobacteriales bacterium]